MSRTNTEQVSPVIAITRDDARPSLIPDVGHLIQAAVRALNDVRTYKSEAEWNVNSDINIRMGVLKLNPAMAAILANGMVEQKMPAGTKKADIPVPAELATNGPHTEKLIVRSVDNVLRLSNEYSGGVINEAQVPSDHNARTNQEATYTRSYKHAANGMLGDKANSQIQRIEGLSGRVDYSNSFTHTSAMPTTFRVTKENHGRLTKKTLGAKKVVNGQIIEGPVITRQNIEEGSDYIVVGNDDHSPINLGPAVAFKKNWRGSDEKPHRISSLSELLTNKHLGVGKGRMTIEQLEDELDEILLQGTFECAPETVRHSEGYTVSEGVTIKVDGKQVIHCTLSLRRRGSNYVIIIPARVIAKGIKIIFELTESVITSYDVADSSLVFYSGSSLPRSADSSVYADDPALRSKVHIQGFQPTDGMKDGDDLFLDMLRHDQWTGLPFEPEDPENKEMIEDVYDLFTYQLSSDRAQETISATVHPFYSRLKYSGLEFQDVRDLYRDRRYKEEVIKASEAYIGIIANVLYGLTTSGDPKKPPPPSHVYLHTIREYFRINYRNSVIYGQHQEVIGSGRLGTTREEFLTVQLARMYYSLFRTKLRHQRLTSVIPNRFIVAQSIPLCLTNKGYLMYEAPPAMLAFFKEDIMGYKKVSTGLKNEVTSPLTGAAGDGFKDLIDKFFNSQFEHRYKDHPYGVVALVNVPLLEIDPENKSLMSHTINMEGKHVNLEPLMAEAYSLAPTDRLCVIYDSRFVMCIFKTSRGFDLDIIVVRTSVRVSRYIPKSKNLAHNNITLPDSTIIPFSSDAIAFTGYMRALIDYSQQL